MKSNHVVALTLFRASLLYDPNPPERFQQAMIQNGLQKIIICFFISGVITTGYVCAVRPEVLIYCFRLLLSEK